MDAVNMSSVKPCWGQLPRLGAQPLGPRPALLPGSRRNSRTQHKVRARRSAVKVQAGIFDMPRPSWLPDFIPWFSPDTASSDEYSKTMQEKMGSSLTYDHSRGMNYARITDNIIVGSCLQTPADVDTLRESENVGLILCLQEDKDMAWWDLDIKPIQDRVTERGDLKHLRLPLRDFDAVDIRCKLASVIGALRPEMEALKGAGETLYVHCTAGLGRAPVVALAYMHWVEGRPLEDAYKQLFAVRPCHPQLKAIREATCDLLCDSSATNRVTFSIPCGEAAAGKLSGLNVGWGTQLEMERVGTDFVVERELPVGRYFYKYILDGEWVCNEAEAMADDGGNMNNVVEVLPADPEDAERWKRITDPEQHLTPDELEIVRGKLAEC